MPELPPQSRITSRIDGEILSIAIPRSPARVGCIGGSWSAAAVFGFLAVCCGTQGLLSGHILWTAAGFSFFLIAGWQILALRGGFLHGLGAIKLEICPESLAKISGSADAPHRQHWLRSIIIGIQIEPKSATGPASLYLQLLGDPSPVRLFSCDDPEEMEWIAEQIRRRLSGTTTV
jgi:hypothetical protein